MMKSRLTLLLALGVLLFLGCVREEIGGDSAIKTFDCFTVSVEKSSGTKVHLEGGVDVGWNVGDRIGVYSDTQEPVPFTYESDGKFLKPA